MLLQYLRFKGCCSTGNGIRRPRMWKLCRKLQCTGVFLYTHQKPEKISLHSSEA